MVTTRYFYQDIELELLGDTICFRLLGDDGEQTELYAPARCAWSMAAALMATAAGTEDKARRIARRMMEEES